MKNGGFRTQKDFVQSETMDVGRYDQKRRVKPNLNAKRTPSLARSAARPCYTLKEMLRRSNGRAQPGKQERDWLNSEPVGDELI
jgi:hypothetical protein